MKKYDVNGDGSLSYEEFINGLREPLSDRRLKLVKKVYSSLGTVTVTYETLAKHFNPFGDHEL